MKRAIGALAMLALLPLATATECKSGGPGTPEYNKRHHLTDTPQPGMANPDPKPERRGPGRPPEGKYVTFRVIADRSMGTILVTYKIGAGGWQTFHMKSFKAWGSVVPVGTPVSVLAAPDKPANEDGTFKHGLITVTISRAPANETEGGPIICQDDNSPGHTGGAQCAGTV